MITIKDTTQEEARIRDMMAEWVEAFQAKDPQRIMEFYSEDIQAYDLMPPLIYKGKQAYRKLWQESFAQMKHPIRLEFKDQEFRVDQDLAYGFSLCRFRSKDPEGEDIDIWSRVTECFRKTGNRWLITHEHTSVPLDVITGKGRMDLNPA